MITADTNVFVYASDPRDPAKNATGRRIVERLEALGGLVALQVVGELQNVLRRKLKFSPPVAAGIARDILLTYRLFPATTSAAYAALDYMEAGRLSYWDALMLASAAEAGCTAMISEDMQDGAKLFGLEVVNPFGTTGMSLRAAELLAIA